MGQERRRRRPGARSRIASPGLLLGLALGYVALSLVVWRVADPTETAAPWWPAAGLTLALLCLTRTGDWPAVLTTIFLADLAADLLEGTHLLTSLGWAGANTIEPLLGALAVRWLCGGRLPSIESPGDVLGLFAVATLAGTPVASFIGGMTSSLTYGTAFLETWRTWYIGDALGILIVTPAVLYTPQIRRGLAHRAFLAAQVGIVAALALVFGVEALPLYLVTPMVVLVAMAFGAPGAVAAALTTAIIAYAVSSAGHGPFALGGGDTSPLLELQVFTLVQLLTVYLVVALRAELLSARARVEVLSEEQLRDPLTGTGSRLRVEAALAAATAGPSVGAPRPVAVLFLDLDGFKPINDAYGHQAGDRILQTVAERLEATVRASDTVGRVGGDEFVVVCRDITQPQLDELAGRLGASVSLPISVNGHAVSIGASIGRSWTADEATPADLLRRADQDMYERKVSRQVA